MSQKAGFKLTDSIPSLEKIGDLKLGLGDLPGDEGLPELFLKNFLTLAL